MVYENVVNPLWLARKVETNEKVLHVQPTIHPSIHTSIHYGVLVAIGSLWPFAT